MSQIRTALAQPLLLFQSLVGLDMIQLHCIHIPIIQFLWDKVTSSQIVKALPEIYPWPVTNCPLPPVDVPCHSEADTRWERLSTLRCEWGISMGNLNGDSMGFKTWEWMNIFEFIQTWLLITVMIIEHPAHVDCWRTGECCWRSAHRSSLAAGKVQGRGALIQDVNPSDCLQIRCSIIQIFLYPLNILMIWNDFHLNPHYILWWFTISW